jgi:hypothetical protein
MFRDDWTPAHLTRSHPDNGGDGSQNLYSEIALALKALEWRTPGLVALASKLTSSRPHRPMAVHVPASYGRAGRQQAFVPPTRRASIAAEMRRVSTSLDGAPARETPAASDQPKATLSLSAHTDELPVASAIPSCASTSPTSDPMEVVSNRLQSLFSPGLPKEVPPQRPPPPMASLEA